MAIHIQTWTGTNSARITDMTDAGRRGCRCRVLRFQGAPWYAGPCETPEQVAAREWTGRIMAEIVFLRGEPANFDRTAHAIRELMEAARAAGALSCYLSLSDESIRAIDAPRVPLTAGVAGHWSAGADETGISLRQLDDVNEWSEITHDQSPARAYAIAAKVWARVQSAATLREASAILCAAGARLHGYCAMD